MLNVERKYIQNVSQSLVDMKQVTEVYSVAGRYDLVAIVRVNHNAEIADTITGNFSTLAGITAPETLLACTPFSRHALQPLFSTR